MSRRVHTVRHPRGSCIVSPLLSLEVATPQNKSTTVIHAVIHTQENPPQTRFLVGCSSPFMRLAKTPDDVCLGRLKPDVLRPGIAGMRGSMVKRLRPCMTISTPPPYRTTTALAPAQPCLRRALRGRRGGASRGGWHPGAGRAPRGLRCL